MDKLNKLIAKERKKLVEQTIETGELPKQDFDRLNRMVKLAAGQRPWRQWSIPAIAFVIPLALVSFLILKHERETQIELDVTVSAFKATLPQKQQILEKALLSTLQADSLAGIGDLSAGDGDCTLDIEPNAKPLDGDAINLQTVEVPKGWRLGLERRERHTEIAFSAPPKSSEEIHSTISISGRARVHTNCGDQRLNRELENTTIQLRIGQRSTLRLTPLETTPLQFARQIDVENLALISEEDYLGDAPSLRRTSSVRTGTIYLNSLNGKPLLLRPSETISFGSFAGKLRSISPAAEGLQIQLFATVRGMEAGEEPNRRSLMPSYLQWIAARSELWLWWGSAASVFAILMSALRWMKVTS